MPHLVLSRSPGAGHLLKVSLRAGSPGQLVQGTGFGIIGDIIIGIIGAFVGACLLPQLGIRIGAGIVNAMLPPASGLCCCCSSSGLSEDAAAGNARLPASS